MAASYNDTASAARSRSPWFIEGRAGAMRSISASGLRVCCEETLKVGFPQNEQPAIGQTAISARRGSPESKAISPKNSPLPSRTGPPA